MKKWLGCAAVAAIFAVPSLAAAGELRLSMGNGRVTIVAQDVTIKQILDEWSRVGQTKIVGAERLPPTLVTLDLRDVAEGRALESLLRSASGYIAKPRALAAAANGTSTIDCVLIMPTSRAPAAVTTAPPFNAGRPQPQVVMPNIVEDDVDTPSPILPPGSVPPPQGQQVVPMPYPGQPPLQPNPQLNQQPQQQTLPRPGMLPQAPNNVPTNPYQNPQPPIRPPGLPGGGVQGQGGPGGGPGGDS